MFHFSFSAALLLTTACFLTTSVVFTEKVTTCDDNRNVHRLACDKGVISVQSSLYGRTDSQTCSSGRPQSQLSNMQCSQVGTTDVIRRRCDGKRACEINTNVVRTPDPCRGIYKYLETTYTCLPAITVVACERSLAHLYCAEGQGIFVYGADYGRRDTTTCSYGRPSSQLQRVTCSQPTSIVADMCNWRNNCTVRASNSVFGDPCGGTYKYLEVAYVCLYPDTNLQFGSIQKYADII